MVLGGTSFQWCRHDSGAKRVARTHLFLPSPGGGGSRPEGARGGVKVIKKIECGSGFTPSRRTMRGDLPPPGGGGGADASRERIFISSLRGAKRRSNPAPCGSRDWIASLPLAMTRARSAEVWRPTPLPPPRCAGQGEARARIASSRALRRRVDGLVRWIKSALLTVLLNTGRAQPGQAVLVD
jgi:hypothetical protein